MRAQLKPIFKTEAEFNAFVDSVADEKAMFDTRQKLVGGSQTAERVAEDTQGTKMAEHGVATAGQCHDRALVSCCAKCLSDVEGSGVKAKSGIEPEDCGNPLCHPDQQAGQGLRGADEGCLTAQQVDLSWGCALYEACSPEYRAIDAGGVQWLAPNEVKPSSIRWKLWPSPCWRRPSEEATNIDLKMDIFSAIREWVKVKAKLEDDDGGAIAEYKRRLAGEDTEPKKRRAYGGARLEAIKSSLPGDGNGGDDGNSDDSGSEGAAAA